MPIAAVDQVPSQRAFTTVVRLARKAVKIDSWMEPVAEWNEEESTTDYSIFSSELIAGWEETVHFHLTYGTKIDELAQQQARRFGIEKSENWEAFFYGFYCPLKDEFWETWMDGHNVFDFWKENVEGK